MAISRLRDVCTALCHSSTTLRQFCEYGCAGAGVLSEGGLGTSSNPFWQTCDVAAHACSSAAQIAEAALQILLRGRIALVGGLEIGERICHPFLKSRHALNCLAGVGQLGRGLLMLQPFKLQAIPLILAPP